MLLAEDGGIGLAAEKDQTGRIWNGKLKATAELRCSAQHPRAAIGQRRIAVVIAKVPQQAGIGGALIDNRRIGQQGTCCSLQAVISRALLISH
jgi:hypothetical protein